MYLKGLVTAAFGSSEPFYFGNGRVLSAPSLHRESTDSLIVERHFQVITHVRSYDHEQQKGWGSHTRKEHCICKQVYNAKSVKQV